MMVSQNEVDLGDGYSYRLVQTFVHGSVLVVGVMVHHPPTLDAPKSFRHCGQEVRWINPGVAVGHRLIQLRPLTVMPHVECWCGVRGYIRDGRWVRL